MGECKGSEQIPPVAGGGALPSAQASAVTGSSGMSLPSRKNEMPPKDQSFPVSELLLGRQLCASEPALSLAFHGAQLLIVVCPAGSLHIFKY